MKTSIRLHRTHRLVRSTVLLAIVAGVGYFAGAVTQNPGAPLDAVAAVTMPIPPSASAAHAAIRVDDGDLPEALDWARSGPEQYIEAPRECDATHGPITECVFMD